MSVQAMHAKAQETSALDSLCKLFLDQTLMIALPPRLLEPQPGPGHDD